MQNIYVAIVLGYFPHVHKVLPESRTGAQKPPQNTKVCFGSARLLTMPHLGYKFTALLGI